MTTPSQKQLDFICDFWDVTEAQIFSHSNSGNVVNARGCLAYILVSDYRLSREQVASYLNLTHSTVTKWVNRIQNYLRARKEQFVEFFQIYTTTFPVLGAERFIPDRFVNFGGRMLQPIACYVEEDESVIYAVIPVESELKDRITFFVKRGAEITPCKNIPRSLLLRTATLVRVTKQ